MHTPESALNPSTGKILKNYESGKQLCHLVYMFNEWNEEHQDLQLGPDSLPYVFRSRRTTQISYKIKQEHKIFEKYNAFISQEAESITGSMDSQKLTDLENETQQLLPELFPDVEIYSDNQIRTTYIDLVAEKYDLPNYARWKKDKDC